MFNMLKGLFAYTALAADKIREWVPSQCHIMKLTAGASDTAYQGSIAAVSPSGYAAVAVSTTDYFPVGIFKKQTVFGSTNPEVEIITGRIWIAYSSAAQSHVGQLLYITDDNTITTTATVGLTPAGLAVGYKSGSLLVDFNIKSLAKAT